MKFGDIAMEKETEAFQVQKWVLPTAVRTGWTKKGQAGAAIFRRVACACTRAIHATDLMQHTVCLDCLGSTLVVRYRALFHRVEWTCFRRDLAYYPRSHISGALIYESLVHALFRFVSIDSCRATGRDCCRPGRLFPTGETRKLRRYPETRKR